MLKRGIFPSNEGAHRGENLTDNITISNSSLVDHGLRHGLNIRTF